MYGIREILDSMSEPPPGIEFLVSKTEQAVAEESADAFDYSKALVESACKTILNDRGVVTEDWEGAKLFREMHKRLNYVPPEHPEPSKFQDRIKNALFGLEQTVKGLHELRNHDGATSHGQDGYHQVFFSYQLQLAARAADAILHFIFSAHRKNPFGINARRIYYEDYPRFNDYIDEIYETTVIFDQIFPASKILFDSDKDHTAYREKIIALEIDVEAGLISLPA